jgi:hypothetical protein
MPGTALVLLAHAAATLFMVGLIWFVQVVHYPLFSRVGSDAFVPYAAAHGVLTTWVVGPPMLLEFATAGWLAPRPPPGVNPVVPWVGPSGQASNRTPGGGSSSPPCCAPRCGPDAGVSPFSCCGAP